MRPTTAPSRPRSRTLLLAAALLATLAASMPSPALTDAPVRAVREKNLAQDLKAGATAIPVIIRFVSAPTEVDHRELVRAGFTGPIVRYQVIPAVAATGPASAVRALAGNPRVAYVESDAVIPYTLDRATQVGRASQTWSAEYTDLAGVHTDGITGRGVGIAIVDTGIDATHPDLLWAPLAVAGRPAKTVANFKMIGRDSAGVTGFAGDDGFIEANTLAVNMPDTDNTGGHGTHCAGIAAGLGVASNGKYKGAAPGANLIGFGAGETLVVGLGLAAFDYIHQHHADPALNIRVVSNSWGGAGDWNPELATTIAAQRLVADGLVVLFAAGNSGGDGSAIATSLWANIDDPGIISVANYYDRRGWLDDSSSRGLRSLERVWPDLAAPGTQIISTSATAGPVSYVGTGQDAAINHLDENGEPDVITAPVAGVPVTVEQNVEGQDVVVGPYASFTGTSMATPFVAGVAALMIEANPALTPQQVRAILRETANMVPGRSYQTDGFAVGKGVVDAAEAVAAALRMKDGDSLADGLRNAYVDTSGPVWKINSSPPRRVSITRPLDGASVSGSVTVRGRYLAGPVTDNTIPLMPPPPPPPPPLPPVQGDAHIYQGGAVDPFVLATDSTVVLPGEPVRLSVRNLRSNDASVVVSAATATAEHRILKDGVLVYGPFVAAITADTNNQRSDVDWTVPADAAPGSYVFEGSVTINASATTYVSDTLTFSIGAPTPPSAGASAPSSNVGRLLPPFVGSTTFFEEGFEEGTEGWTIQNEGNPLTDWTMVTDDLVSLTWAGFKSEESHRMFFAGNVPTALAGTAVYYDELADSSLISPSIDLTSATEASLKYWRAGQSEHDTHYLRVYAAEDVATPAWVQLEEFSGDVLNSGYAGDWEEITLNLAAFVGKSIRVRFQFDSTTVGLGTFHPWLIGGWFIDDVSVTGSSGTPVTTIVPSLSGLPTIGVGSLTTTFLFGGQSNVPITGYTLDFGDGSPVHTATAAGGIEHDYAAGQWTATLTVAAGTETKSASIPIDVAKIGEIQVRIGNGAWIDAGQASTKNKSWRLDLDLTGLTGPQTIEVRHYDALGNLVKDSITVNVV